MVEKTVADWVERVEKTVADWVERVEKTVPDWVEMWVKYFLLQNLRS